MLFTDVSWRCEPGINRAYVWLSDQTVLGYRDLDTGLDHLISDEHRDLLVVSVEEWLRTYGAPCPRVGSPEPPLTTSGWGPLAWWRRRRELRAERARQEASTRWRLDHPAWRIPVDPPHGGWRDLVRNDPGDGLWQHQATLAPPSIFDRTGRREARAWRVGAMGEETVGAELWRIARRSDQAWRFVHSVPVGRRGSDIDHVLVGPAGVFSINTKSHIGARIWVGGSTFMVNGRHQPYLRNSRFEAERASRLLTKACDSYVAVTPLIVVVDPRDLTIRQAPDGVAVTTRKQLRRWLRAQPAVLGPDEVSAVFDVVRRSTTWTQ